MTNPNHEVERRIKLLLDELTDCKIRANDRLERLEKAEERAAELQKQLADERCHRHGAFNPEGDCPFCDKEQAEAERNTAKAQLLTELAEWCEERAAATLSTAMPMPLATRKCELGRAEAMCTVAAHCRELAAKEES